MKIFNKKTQNNKSISTQGGQAMIISVLYFLFVSFSIISGFVSPAVREVKTSSVNLFSKNSYYLAESGNEDAVYRTMNLHSISEVELITIGSNTVTTTISDDPKDKSLKQVVSVGDLNSYQRKINTKLSWNSAISFDYAVQAGTEGVNLSTSSIIGSVYSNGPIIGDRSSSITESATSASSGVSASADQSNGLDKPYYDIDFGNLEVTQDISQSFVPSVSGHLTKVDLFLKKEGKPKDLTLKIVNTSGGRGPGTTVYATATIPTSFVSENYSWIDVVFSSNAVLSEGTSYSLVVDSIGSDKNNYYIAGASEDSEDLPSSYSNGRALVGQFGGLWANVYGMDYDHFFKIYLSGEVGLIAGSSGSAWAPFNVGTIKGDANANTINYTNNMNGGLFCQNGVGNNIPCVYKTDSTYLDYPILDSSINQWKNEATNTSVISGNYNLSGNSSVTLGPAEIKGNLYISDKSVLTVSGTLFVRGNITLLKGGQIKLSSAYGDGDGVVIADGTISISSGSAVTGSGSLDSYILLLSTSSSANAISMSGGSDASVLYSPNGTINISGSSTLKQATANKLIVSGDSVITYESGLKDVSLNSGSDISFIASRIYSWQETR